MAATDKTRIAKQSPIEETDQGQLVTRRGISREVVEELSKIKGEPDWMREKRLKSLEIFMNKCVPPQDNKFSALHGAIWSGGSFVYVPPGVKLDLPLQAYFRMEGANEGTFEHTLIIADEGSDVNYIEGCTAQTYSVNSMHSAVVEIFVHEGAKARYTTVQNWSKDVYNLNTKRAVVDAEGTVEGVGGSVGAKYVMLYPGSYLLGEGARADHLNVGVASGDVHKDTGAKVVHQAPNTTSNILAKSISKDGGIMGYRGLVKMGQHSKGSKARVQCDGLMMEGIQ